MGKEVTCPVQWASESALCKVLLESRELIFRAPFRRTVPVASINQVEVHGDRLRLHIGKEIVQLTLGSTVAQNWAKKLTTPPPTLAAKLGITASTAIALLGTSESEELNSVAALAQTSSSTHPDLILASVQTPKQLEAALAQYPAQTHHPPLWIIYPKGPGKPLNEVQVIQTLRQQGFTDTKVASVSPTLTALRFIRRG